MAPNKQAKISQQQHPTGSSRSESTSIEGSQELEVAQIQELQKKTNERVRFNGTFRSVACQEISSIALELTRGIQVKEVRRARKKGILEAHNARIEKLHSDIRQCSTKYDEKV